MPVVAHRPPAHGVVGGRHTRPALIDATGPQDGVQYALTPLGARAALDAGAAELRGEVVDLADVLGRRSADLLERPAGCSISTWLREELPVVHDEVAAEAAGSSA